MTTKAKGEQIRAVLKLIGGVVDWKYGFEEALGLDIEKNDPAVCEFIAACIAELEAQVPRWVPVGERLPAEDDLFVGFSALVIICLSNGFRTSGFYDYRQQRWVYRHSETTPHLLVTHWMELPPAPKARRGDAQCFPYHCP